MCKAVDEVENSSTKLKRDPWTRTAGADVAEEGVAIVVEENVFPPKGSEGGSARGHLRFLLL